jgi:superfamily II DNA or RNA helicase
MKIKVKVRKLNEVFFKIDCDISIQMELKDHFSFYAPNYKFAPLYKSKKWDGKIYLYNLKSSRLYIGLFLDFFKFCEERNYSIEIEDNKFYGNLRETCLPVEVDQNDTQILDSIEFKYELRDYQMEAILEGIRKKRKVFILPTGSGKSAVIYYLSLWYSLKQNNKKILIVVPTTGLVEQLTTDFTTYAQNTLNVDLIRKIYSGQKEHTHKSPITISTWQSLANVDKSFFSDYGMIIVDEAHGATAKVLTSIIEHCSEAEYRFGFTGTIRNSVLNELQLTGLLGPIKKFITTKELQTRNQLADLSIKCLVLKYSEQERQQFYKLQLNSKKETEKDKSKYQKEVDYILSSSNRNHFICNLAFSLSGITLVLFSYIENHGKPMYQIALEKNKIHGRKIFFVSGETSVDDREAIRQIVETEKNAIIFASVQVMGTGVNIPSLENIIFTFSTKSSIRVLQSIGRALRISETKTKANLYDIIDNISWKSRNNYGMKHALERISFYEQEKFKYQLKEIPFIK